MKPLVSVVIPTFRRPQTLNRCLDALMRQTADPAQFDVIVVDDGNDAETRQAVEALAQQAKFQLRYLGQPERRGPAAARNRGWQAAEADVIGFTDDDCIPQESWIEVALAAFADGAQVISGQVRMPLSDKPTDYERVNALLETAEFVTANCFCRKDALAKVGGLEESFDIAWREDSDLQFKFLENDIPVLKCRDLVILHPCKKGNWRSCLKDERKNSYDALLYKRHPKLFRERIPAYSGLVALYYTLVVSFLLGVLFTLTDYPYFAVFCFGVWGAFLSILIIQRLWASSLAPSHVGEVVITSVAAPFLSVYWRLYGAVKHRTLYW